MGTLGGVLALRPRAEGQGAVVAEQTDRIYAEYQLNLLTAGHEQVALVDGAGVARSDRLLAGLRDG